MLQWNFQKLLTKNTTKLEKSANSYGFFLIFYRNYLVVGTVYDSKCLSFNIFILFLAEYSFDWKLERSKKWYKMAIDDWIWNKSKT